MNSQINSQINIGYMTEEDVDCVHRIELASFSMPWSRNSLLDAVTNANARYIVARLDANVVGYVGMWYGGDEAEITNVAVDETFRNQGIAGKLMEKAYEIAKDAGMEKLYLEVRESNEPAKSVYVKSGFKEIGVRKNFYEKPVENAIIMIRRIE